MPPRVSLCMIVKDEEANLPDCLQCATGLADELIIVDTGSSDATREIAFRFGAQVHDFPWTGDFSAARNESIRHATGEWIFWLDADDRIDEPNRQKLQSLFANLPDELVGYVVTYVDVSNQSPADHVQVFRNHPQVRWEYRLHEQILPSLERAGGRACPTDIVIHTIGYTDPTVVRQKLERNLDLLRREDAERPSDPFTQLNLGRTILRLGHVAQAIPYLRAAVQQLPAGQGFLLHTAYTLMAEAYNRLGQNQEALQVCIEGRSRLPEDRELLLAEGIMRANLSDNAGALDRLEELLRHDPHNVQAQAIVQQLRPGRPFFQITV